MLTWKQGYKKYKAGELMVRVVDEHSACLDPTIPSITSKERTCDHFGLNKYLPGTKEWKDLVRCLKEMANKVPLYSKQQVTVEVHDGRSPTA